MIKALFGNYWHVLLTKNVTEKAQAQSCTIAAAVKGAKITFFEKNPLKKKLARLLLSIDHLVTSIQNPSEIG